MQLVCPSREDHRMLKIARVLAIAAFVLVCPSAATMP